MKGIVLAGGKGTRLYPLTKTISKQLLPVYDKPMIYYPISILMLAGIKDILIISTEKDLPMYQELLGNGAKIGINLSYEVQKYPRGLADAFIIGEKFIGNDCVCLILGDNIFYGGGIRTSLEKAINNTDGSTIFAYRVKNPSDFGVVEFDDKGKAISLEEKPKKPRSSYAIPGLYFYDNNVIKIAQKVIPSSRGEIEITSINNEYLKRGKLKVIEMTRGLAWLDTGTISNLQLASNFVKCVQEQQGNYVACLEEIAYRMNFITLEKLEENGEELSHTEYGQYIISIVKEEKTNYTNGVKID